jgi:hypothetical protein
MPFIEMDPELVFAAIEGYNNELVDEQKRLDTFYRQFVCKRCGGQCRTETHRDPRHAFGDPDVLVPRSILRCLTCDCLFDPHSGILLELGNPMKAIPEIPIFGKSK